MSHDYVRGQDGLSSHPFNVTHDTASAAPWSSSHTWPESAGCNRGTVPT